MANSPKKTQAGPNKDRTCEDEQQNAHRSDAEVARLAIDSLRTSGTSAGFIGRLAATETMEAAVTSETTKLRLIEENNQALTRVMEFLQNQSNRLAEYTAMLESAVHRLIDARQEWLDAGTSDSYVAVLENAVESRQDALESASDIVYEICGFFQVFAQDSENMPLFSRMTELANACLQERIIPLMAKAAYTQVHISMTATLLDLEDFEESIVEITDQYHPVFDVNFLDLKSIAREPLDLLSEYGKLLAETGCQNWAAWQKKSEGWLMTPEIPDEPNEITEGKVVAYYEACVSSLAEGLQYFDAAASSLGELTYYLTFLDPSTNPLLAFNVANLKTSALIRREILEEIVIGISRAEGLQEVSRTLYKTISQIEEALESGSD